MATTKEPYKPPQEFQEVQVEPLVEEALSDTTELWLIQMPLTQFEPADFKGKQLSLKLPEADGWMGCLENSRGKSYDMFCFGGQGMEPFAFLPRSSTSMGVRKISRHICLLNANKESGDASGRADSSAVSGSKIQDTVKREGISQDQGRSVGSVGQKSSRAISAITSEGEPSTKKRGKFSKEKGLNGTPTVSHSRNLEESGRVLHSGSPDNLMDEIPTYVVHPLPQGKDQGYVVLNRPWAFVQWLNQADIKEEYILMAEPDHIIVKPIPNLAKGSLPAAFPFFYITPEKYENVIRKFFPEDNGPITNIDPIGNSPVIIKKESLEKIAPTWLNVSLAMKMDSEADKAFGWVLEMYGYAIASALHGERHSLRKDFMIQPPWDLEVAEKFIIHYTYGCDYDLKGKLTYGKIGEWRFDKRSFDQGAPPKNLPLPPPGVPESVVTLVKMVNEATSNIPNWKEGE